MSIEDKALWEAARAGIQEMTKGRTNGHLTHLEYQRSDGNRLVIKVNGPKQERDWLNDRLRDNFERELWRLTNRFYTVEFLLNIPTIKLLPCAGDRFGHWLEWPAGYDAPVVAGCWRLSDEQLSSGYTPGELSRALAMLGRVVPEAVIRREWGTALVRLEFVK